MVAARLIFETKRIFGDGHIVQARIWAVPKPVRGSRHDLKYSLFYGKEGERLIGYDNEAGKGDHRHYGDQQEAYTFATVEQLVSDFLRDVSAMRGGEI